MILAALAALVFLGLALEELFKKTKIPDVLILMLLGLGLSAAGVLETGSMAGVGRVFTTIALVLILFEGAVRMRLDELRSALGRSLALTLVNFFGTMIVVGLIAWGLFGMRPLAGLLLGSILGGTSSAVVIPMVQSLKLGAKTKTALTLESALSDVLCIMFALAFVGALSAAEVQLSQVGLELGVSFGGAILVGVGAGVIWAFGLVRLRRRRTSLLAAASAVFLVHALAESLSTSGAIACLAFGIVLGNAPALARSRADAAEFEMTEGERLFLSEVAFLLKVFFFVYLGASLKLSGYEPLLFGGITALACFVLRPFVIRLTFGRKDSTRHDAAVASALVPKGLAAAVLAALPLQAGIAEGQTIEAIAFGVILFSILGASVLIAVLDKSFVGRGYGRFFSSYLPDAEPTSEAPPAAEVVPLAAPLEYPGVEEPTRDSSPSAAG